MSSTIIECLAFITPMMSEAQIILHMICLMYVETTQHLNYRGQEHKKTQFAVHVSDTPVALNQDQDHQA